MFHLLDLESQARAVQELLRGKSVSEKVSWLSAHGKIEPKAKLFEGERQVYLFTSATKSECAFFVDGDEFVFMGDHTTYTVQPG